MIYSQPLYRPPSEANSLIFQVTEGCSFNRCSFCSMYREKEFSEKPLATVLTEISNTAIAYPDVRRVFLADGDALYRSTDDLIKILAALYQAFPHLNRVSSYALPNNLISKSEQELSDIRKAGLQLIYYGIESGSAGILKCITKGATPEKMITGLNKASAAGLQISATVILGLAGTDYWQEHIQGTAELVNQLSLTYLSTLQLTLDETIRDEFIQKFSRKGREFKPQTDDGMLQEQVAFIAQIDPKQPVTFRSNHASNALPLKGILPADKENLLAVLQSAHEGVTPLVPRWMRGL